MTTPLTTKEVMPAIPTYRAHAGGYWSSAQSRYSTLSDVEELVEAYEVVNRYLDHRFERQIAKEVSRVYEMGSVNLYRAGQNSAARVSAWRAFRRRPLSALKRWRAAAVFVLAATRSAIGASAETPARRAS